MITGTALPRWFNPKMEKDANDVKGQRQWGQYLEGKLVFDASNIL